MIEKLGSEYMVSERVSYIDDLHYHQLSYKSVPQNSPAANVERTPSGPSLDVDYLEALYRPRWR